MVVHRSPRTRPVSCCTHRFHILFIYEPPQTSLTAVNTLQHPRPAAIWPAVLPAQHRTAFQHKPAVALHSRPFLLSTLHRYILCCCGVEHFFRRHFTAPAVRSHRCRIVTGHRMHAYFSSEYAAGRLQLRQPRRFACLIHPQRPRTMDGDEQQRRAVVHEYLVRTRTRVHFLPTCRYHRAGSLPDACRTTALHAVAAHPTPRLSAGILQATTARNLIRAYTVLCRTHS